MTDLHEAFLQAPEDRPDLAAAVTARIRANDRRRRMVILASTGAGVGLALSAFASSGVLDREILGHLAELARKPWAIAVLGLALTAFAMRESLAEL